MAGCAGVTKPNRILVFCMATVCLVACGDGLLTPTAAQLSGLWSRVGEVPGSSEQWNLSVSDTTITGTGHWTGEACCDGSLTVNGYITADSLHLEVRQFNSRLPADSSYRKHVDAVMYTPNDIVGTTTSNGFSGSIHMRRGGFTF